MPRRLRSSRIFHVSARMILAISRDAFASMRKLHPDADATDLLICFAAFIGHFEGRPMNHSKLAAFCGIPRATVVRRVKKLVVCRMLEFSCDGKTISTPKHRLSGDEPNALSAGYVRYIQHASKELSKMDT